MNHHHRLSSGNTARSWHSPAGCLGAAQVRGRALRARGLFAGLLLPLLVVVAPVQALPQAFSASYVAMTRGFSLGTARLELVRDGVDHYRYASDLRPAGPLRLVYRGEVREHSSGTLVDGVPAPDAYAYRRTGPGGREDSVRFAENDGISLLTYRGETTEHRLPQNALDPLSLHLALMHDVARGAESMRYLVVEPRRVTAYEVELRGRERVHTPHGEHDALRVEVVGALRVGDPANFPLETAEIPALDPGESTTFWFAPELEYLAVRIRDIDPDIGTIELALEGFDR
jgi:hypothetical protein